MRAATVRRTEARLADGRDIFFYDRPGAPERQVHDPRDLSQVRGTMHIRYDRVLDEWVTIASLRQQRTHLPPLDECPLCPSRGGRSTEIPQEDYDVVVFANRFPSFVPTPSLDSVLATQRESARIVRPSSGRCEVVCFTSDHDASFADLEPARARLVVDTWADRTRELSAQPGASTTWPTRSATSSPRSIWTCSGGSTACTTGRCPTSRPGTRRPYNSTATSRTPTCSCSRCSGPPIG